MELDIQHCDAKTFLEMQEPESIDCFLTSPPYDKIRKYKGFSFDFEPIAQGMVKALSRGGVILWNVADQTKDRDQSGTSFRQALYFKELGLKLNETIILQKNAFPYPSRWTHYACHEYLFVFSKGNPSIFSPLHDRPNKQAGKITRAAVRIGKEETLVATNKSFKISNFGRRGSVWTLEVGGGKQGGKGIEHPAKMNLRLVLDCLRIWTLPESCICDPFLGSGTTLSAAAMLGRRRGIGCDVSNDYLKIAHTRISQAELGRDN